MKTVTKYEHDVEIIHEPSGEVLTFKFVADEETEMMDIFKQFVHDLSNIVHDVEEIEEEIEEEEEDK